MLLWLHLAAAASVGKKAKDLRNWLTVYSYWNQGGQGNVVAMFAYLVDQYFKPTGVAPSRLVETPATGQPPLLVPNKSLLCV